jgi:hypothetical protein
LSPSFWIIAWIAAAVGLRPTYWAASSAEFCPANRGIRKKMQNVMTLTARSRWMMKVTMGRSRASAQPGLVAAAGRLPFS